MTWVRTRLESFKHQSLFYRTVVVTVVMAGLTSAFLAVVAAGVSAAAAAVLPAEAAADEPAEETLATGAAASDAGARRPETDRP